MITNAQLDEIERYQRTCTCRSDVAALVAEVRRLCAAMSDFAELDCAYGDGCPTFGGSHGRCTGCIAREVLGLSGALK